jgi:hypothetical protein
MEVFQNEELFEINNIPNTFYFLGDVHEGNCNHDKKAFAEAVKIIKEDKNCKGVFLMGDLIDCIINALDPRFDPLEIAEEYKIRDLKDLPRKQAERVYETLKPIEHLILACVVGNHEEQYIKRHSFNVYDHYCKLFASKPVKLGYVGFYRLRFIRKNSGTRHKIDLALNHGQGGGGFREGYPLNKLFDTFRWTQGDVHIMGHVHTLMEDEQNYMTVGDNVKLKMRKVLYGISGCFLKTSVDGNTNYFEHKGRPQSKIGMLRLDAWVHGKKQDLKYSLTKIKFD